LTASNIQLNSLTDTTAANKVLVLDTATNKIFTTASVGTGGGGSGTGFPFSGSGVITGSLLISSSATGLALTVTGSTILTGSGLIFQVSGSASIRDNFTVNGNTLFVNAGQNRVGIGTGRPSVTLEVSGDTIITGSLLVSGSGLVVSGATQLFGPLRVANQTAVNTSMSVVVGNVPGYIQFNATPDIVYYDFSNAQVVTNAGMISPGDIVSRGNIKNDGGKDVKITGGTAGVTSITSSLSVEGAGATNTTVYGNNTINDFSQIINQNLSNGVNASTDFVLAKDDATDFQEFVDFGINSTGFVGLIGNANDAYLYVTSSTGELVIGNASGGPKGNIRLFTSGGDTDNVTRVFISSSGNVGIGITSGLQSRLTVSGSVSASSYTSSFNNAVGYFGTSS
jgi:hypothetical protein